ncbi:MAG: helix-turn-helix domain-containing protein [Chloroflexi bacterium]|nr:helix-turn-helix domain-containing protein [Chloroflexota bacterium]
MITNERQYRITKSQAEKLKRKLLEFDITSKAKELDSRILATAEFEAIKSEISELTNQLLEYERLKSGIESRFEAKSLSELPNILICARIAQNLTQKQLAELVGLKEQQIQRYEADQYVSANLKRLLEIADALKISIKELARIEPISESDETNKTTVIAWNEFPIKEMYQRGWFEGFSGSLDSLREEGEMLVRNYIESYKRNPIQAFHRLHVRSESHINPYALLAWECRVISLSVNDRNLGEFKKQNITPEWITDFIKLSRHQNGPFIAKEKLHDVGIALVIEPHLKNTFLDGAALLYKNSPIIGMTLRYDRLDNFWFVILHELMHIVHHLQDGKLENIFDDLDVEDTHKIEIEADKYAGEELIPTEAWTMSLAQFTRSRDSINDLADKLEISPAIIAGRIRYEAKNYVILNDLIGQGEVRKHFPDVIFGV